MDCIPGAIEIDTSALPNPWVKDLRGRTFGRLTVIAYAGSDGNGNAKWWCVCAGPSCDVGKRVSVRGDQLKRGRTRSCGCIGREIAPWSSGAHRLSGHPLYSIWYDMISRCTNPRSPSFPGYGGRGIEVCSEWSDPETGLVRFTDDMSDGYERGLQIDRRDNEQGYSKANCRWATPKENGRNRRNNRLITYRGQTRCVAEWAEVLNLSKWALKGRLNRDWPAGRTLTEGVAPDRITAVFGDDHADTLF